MNLNRRLFLRALVGAAIAAPALTSLIRAGQASQSVVTSKNNPLQPAKSSGGTVYPTDDNNTIHFNTGRSKEILRLSPEGMYYNGEYIEDAGLAHQAFLETLTQMGWRGK